MNKPVVLVVMDGVGETPEELGNMVMRANTPTLDEFKADIRKNLEESKAKEAKDFPVMMTWVTVRLVTTHSAAVRSTHREQSS